MGCIGNDYINVVNIKLSGVWIVIAINKTIKTAVDSLSYETKSLIYKDLQSSITIDQTQQISEFSQFENVDDMVTYIFLQGVCNNVSHNIKD